MPDTKPPVHYTTDGNILEGSLKKFQDLERRSIDYYEFLGPLIEHDAEFKDIIRSRHPDFSNYSRAEKAEHSHAMLIDHPRYLAKMARVRNVVQSIPSGATATRPMRPLEQQFLTRAFRRLKSMFQAHPFRIHGETAISGNRQGRLFPPVYSPHSSVTSTFYEGYKYHLHTHPPFWEPVVSSASTQDHIVAAELYGFKNNKMDSFVTNGKDVLHIPPDSTELIKLIPDSRWEKKLGEFPVAFTVPDPQRPPNPFFNNEAPGAL